MHYYESIVKTKHRSLTSLAFMQLVPGSNRAVRHICIRCIQREKLTCMRLQHTSVPRRGRAFTRWKGREKIGYGTDFIRSVRKEDHRRLWTLFTLNRERIKLKGVKYRSHVKIVPCRSTFYPSRSIFSLV